MGIRRLAISDPAIPANVAWRAVAAAQAVFDHYELDPLECAIASDRRGDDDFDPSSYEDELIDVWDKAADAAFRAAAEVCPSATDYFGFLHMDDGADRQA